MDALVCNALLRRSGAERAQLIGRVRMFVTNDNFVNVLNLVDINDRKGDHTRKVCAQFRAFSGDKALESQVREWIKRSE